MPRKCVLAEAAAIVNGPRRKSYGDPKKNHARTAALFSAYLGIKVDERDVCHLNSLQKMSRDKHGRKRDNLRDICGWTKNAALVSEDGEQ